jgi:hypothetical protein
MAMEWRLGRQAAGERRMREGWEVPPVCAKGGKATPRLHHISERVWFPFLE